MESITSRRNNRRSYLPTQYLQQKGANGHVPLSTPAWHYFANVLRLGIGTPVTVFDGNGQVVHGKLAADPRPCLIQTFTESVTNPLPSIWVAQAITSRPKAQEIVRRCTELGVGGFVLFHSNRCSVRLESFKHKHVETLQRVAQDATRQSEQWHVPCIDDPVPFEQLLSHCKTFEGLCVLGNPRQKEKTSHLREFAQQNKDNICKKGTLVIVGPEGGFTPDEQSALEKVGAHSTLWAPYVLRTETAASAAIAILHAYLG